MKANEKCKSVQDLVDAVEAAQERAIFPNASDRIGLPRPKPGAAFWRCELRDLERNSE